ncbi:MAG: asparagine synthase (glutamine-hydrolyzing) [Sediminibacterium sp.]|nr:asparagine synthase (glutamine-hydrolyzing) [Sediminibacterium sp.]
MVITYNGEVYNFIELREELVQLGYVFYTTTDTEVILAAFKAWGPACLNKFNGMWSFAILDKSTKKVFMARDRFGVKPFYYSQNSGNFVFGSEIKQLLNDQENVVNLNVLTEYMLTYIDNHGSDTYFKGVHSLLPGHYLINDLETADFSIEQYYILNTKAEVEQFSKLEAVTYLKDLFTSAVKLRLRSDVKVGTCLSGGLDSSAVSAIANNNYKEAAGRKFTAIHARSIDAETDESSFATDVSNNLDLELHVVTPSTADFKSLVDEVVYTQEEPFGSPSMFMGYKVFQKAKELGCKVMLNGQGGDEVLLGYERYFSSYLYQIGLVEGIKQLWKQSKNSGLKLHDPLLYFVYFTSFRIRKSRLLRRSFLSEELKNKFDLKEIKRSIDSFKNISKLQIHEISTVQLPHLLRYEDRNSMRNSIETRLPFLDYRVVEAGVSFLPKFKIWNGWTKYVLRLAIEDVLPNHVVWRKNKLGFNAPERSWLSAHKETMVAEVAKSTLLKSITNFELLQQRFPDLPYKEQWLYYNIAVWERIYDVKLPD